MLMSKILASLMIWIKSYSAISVSDPHVRQLWRERLYLVQLAPRCHLSFLKQYLFDTEQNRTNRTLFLTRLNLSTYSVRQNIWKSANLGRISPNKQWKHKNSRYDRTDCLSWVIGSIAAGWQSSGQITGEIIFPLTGLNINIDRMWAVLEWPAPRSKLCQIMWPVPTVESR